MGFNQRAVKNFFTGAATAYSASGAATTGMNGTNIPLNGITATSITSSAGAVLSVAAGSAMDIEWDSLVALVQYKLTTNTITAQGRWQGSLDGTNWSDIVGINAPANVTVAAAGTGSLVTTTVLHAFAGVNPGIGYIRYAILDGVATGAAGDNVIVSYCFRKRWLT